MRPLLAESGRSAGRGRYGDANVRVRPKADIRSLPQHLILHNMRPPRISRAWTLTVSLVAASSGAMFVACAQSWATDQRTMITSAVYGVAHDCSRKFPERAQQIESAFSALKERNKHVVPSAAWQGAAAIWPTTPSAAFDSLKVEMCEYFLEASVEGGEFDRDLRASEVKPDRALSP